MSSIWKSISPPLRSQDSDSYSAEPYCLPGNVDGPLSTSPGRAGWTWYTGSAAWLSRISIEYVIGARADWDVLRIDPCPMPQLGQVRANRRWRGRDIVIEFDANEYQPDSICVLVVNGTTLDSNVITEKMVPVGSNTLVRVQWKPKSQSTIEVHIHNRERSKTC